MGDSLFGWSGSGEGEGVVTEPLKEANGLLVVVIVLTIVIFLLIGKLWRSRGEPERRPTLYDVYDEDGGGDDTGHTVDGQLVKRASTVSNTSAAAAEAVGRLKSTVSSTSTPGPFRSSTSTPGPFRSRTSTPGTYRSNTSTPGGGGAEQHLPPKQRRGTLAANLWGKVAANLISRGSPSQEFVGVKAKQPKTGMGGGIKWVHVQSRDRSVQLAESNNGTVWRCSPKSGWGGGVLDVKFHDPEQHPSRLEEEVAVLLTLGSCEKVISMLGYSYSAKPGSGFIAYEYCDQFALLDLLRSHRQSHLDTPLQTVPPSSLQTFQMLDFAAQIASGMEFIHRCGVVHSNLAARSVSVAGDRSSGSECKISGLSHGWVAGSMQEAEAGVSGDEAGGHRPAGWYKWASLEALCHNKHTQAGDLWSFGMVLYEIFACGDLPYPGLDNADELRTWLSEGNRITLHSGWLVPPSPGLCLPLSLSPSLPGLPLSLSLSLLADNLLPDPTSSHTMNSSNLPLPYHLLTGLR
jgi:hypothetical protein